jgi:hypothetical protein
MLPNKIFLYANNLKRIQLTCTNSLNDNVNCEPRVSVASYECEKGYIFENNKSN